MTIRKRMNVRVSYSTITEESASHGDHADHGWIDPDYENRHTLNDDDRDTTIELSQAGAYDWPSLRDAMRFMSEHTRHIETCWDIENSRLGMTLYGTGGDGEDGELECCYDLHIDNVSDGTAMRLARVMADNGVYFANVRRLQVRRQQRHTRGRLA